MITPADIENKDFSRVKRGYDMEEVDDFLDLIIVDMEKLLREMAGREAAGSKTRMWQQSICRDILALLSEVDDVSTVKALHHFLREEENAPARRRMRWRPRAWRARKRWRAMSGKTFPM